MRFNHKSSIALVLWIAVLLCIGSLIGSLTRAEVNTWYVAVNRSPLTPPNYVFGIVWPLLYAMIATCGWLLWAKAPSPKLTLIKSLYVLQLLLNWTWTPLFFSYHFTGTSFGCLLVIDILVMMIMYLSYISDLNIKLVTWLMTPYLLWLLLATHLNFYIWMYN